MEVLLIKFIRSSDYDSSACLVVPRMRQPPSIINRNKVTENERTKFPYDGRWHTDTVPWSKEDDLYNLGLRKFNKGFNEKVKGMAGSPDWFKRQGINIDDWDYVAGDLPGWSSGPPLGTRISVKFWQEVLVVDVNSHQQVVKKELPPLEIEGTFPIAVLTPKLTFGK